MHFLHLNRVDKNTILGAIYGGTNKFKSTERNKTYEQDKIQKAIQRTGRRGIRNDEHETQTQSCVTRNFAPTARTTKVVNAAIANAINDSPMRY